MATHDRGFSDLLNFAHLVDDGIIVNKDGALMMSFDVRGPDLKSASGTELDALSHTMNQMAQVLEDGWMLHIDEIRCPVTTYPVQGDFPDSVSRLIDEERRQQYEAEGTHFENKTIFTFVWKFPTLKINKLQHWFVEGADKEDDLLSLQTLIHLFKDKINRCEGLLSLHFWLTKLSSSALLSYLNTCISGELLPFQVPPDGSFLDVALSRHNVVGGYLPKVGDKHVMILALASYVNEQTRPALLEGLGTYPMIYRWSNRFVFLSEHTAGKEIKRYTRDWNNKIKGFSGILKEAFTGNAAQKINHDASAMKAQTVEADAMNQSQTTRFGYYTSNVILMHEDATILRESAGALRRYLEQTGFGIIEENVNAMDAWLGSIPGHGSRNIRRLFFNAIHWAHCLPLHTTWSGNAKAHPSSLLGPQSPPVFYASTREKTPFRFWPDIQDVGHMLVLGPTGNGKSTFLQLYMAQFLRYSGARVFIFDKDNSHKGLTYALGGEHYHIHPDTALTFCPLADLSTQGRALRAEKWIEDLVRLQGVELTPARRQVIHQAIQSFQEEQCRHGEATVHLRNLSVLRNQLQDTVLRDALSYYTLGGSMPLMDATQDGLRKASHINTFELNWLLNEEPETYTPVISYLTDHIDALIEDSHHQPTLIVIEEMSFILKNPLLAEKVINWTKVLRKFNGRIVFATQALTDLYDAATKTLNAVTASILNSCPIKVFLPNTTMEEQDRSLYYQMGFSERECELLASDAVPKKHYFVRTSEGKRLIDLGFSEKKAMSLSFLGLSKAKTPELIQCKAQHGDTWVYHWLCAQGFPEWADYWLKQHTGDVCEKN